MDLCRSLLLHGWIGRIGDRSDPPAVGRFDQLPGLAAAVFIFPIFLENKIEIDCRDGSIRMDDDIAVLRIEGLGRGRHELREIAIPAGANLQGLRLLACARSYAASVSTFSQILASGKNKPESVAPP